MADEKILSALLVLGIDKKSIDAVRQGLKTVDQALVETATKAEKAKQSTERMEDALKKLDKIGSGVRRLGMGLNQLGEFFNNDQLRKVVQMTAGIGDLTESVRGLYELGTSFKSMGGLGKVIGAGAAVAGGAMLGAGIYDATIGKAQGTNSDTIVKQTLSAAGATLSGVFTQIRDGQGYAEAYRKTLDDTARSYGLLEGETENYNEQLTRQKQAYGSLTGALIALEKQLNASAQASQQQGSFSAIGGFITGSVGKLIGAAASVSAETDPAVQAFADYQKAATDLEQRYGAERLKIIADQAKQANNLTANFAKANAQAYRTYEQQRMQIAQSGIEQEQKIETDYYKQRNQRAAAFGLETQRMEEDHQRNMARAQEDHGRSLRRLAESRDALGIEDEQENYEIQRRRAEEDYQVQAGRSSEDYARELADQEAVFTEQRDQRQADRAVQLAELKTKYQEDASQRANDYAEQLGELKQTGRERLDEFDNQHRQDLDKLRTAWDEQRKNLGLWLDGERALYDSYMKGRAEDLQKWVDTHLVLPGGSVSSGKPDNVGAPGHAAGGYAAGLTMTGERGYEFVMSHDTTRAAEQVAGGRRLDQETVIGLMGGGAEYRGAFAPSVNVNIGPVNGGDPQAIGAVVERQVYAAITRVFNEAIKQ